MFFVLFVCFELLLKKNENEKPFNCFWPWGNSDLAFLVDLVVLAFFCYLFHAMHEKHKKGINAQTKYETEQ